ncbi:hypothetical protein EG328_006591 [Venturia inaequalis]|uniref:Uncharacterized protein n=1 Tax=Venturia inaequalis TaxID=5025 RepID=A0A8H3VDP4_VENIN|nr:hypothetical protein EG328_006591 [Venturia inaequalis]
MDLWCFTVKPPLKPPFFQPPRHWPLFSTFWTLFAVQGAGAPLEAQRLEDSSPLSIEPSSKKLNLISQLALSTILSRHGKDTDADADAAYGDDPVESYNRTEYNGQKPNRSGNSQPSYDSLECQNTPALSGLGQNITCFAALESVESAAISTKHFSPKQFGITLANAVWTIGRRYVQMSKAKGNAPQIAVFKDDTSLDNAFYTIGRSLNAGVLLRSALISFYGLTSCTWLLTSSATRYVETLTTDAGAIKSSGLCSRSGLRDLISDVQQSDTTPRCSGTQYFAHPTMWK